MTKTAETVLKSARENNNEPVLVLRAKDMVSLSAIHDYYDHCVAARCNSDFLEDLRELIHDFADWRKDHETQIKIPD